MLPRAFTVALAIAAVTVVATASASISPTTKVLYVAPVDRAGDPIPGLSISRVVRGTCEPGSDSVPGPVYRCFSANNVIDPCWADRERTGSVLCPLQPWSSTAIELRTKGLEPSGERVPTSLSYPWGVQLANGDRCVAAQGAHDPYRGRVVDYACGGAYRLVLLRGIHRRHEPWTYDSAIWTGQEYVKGPTETVRTAWYGGPAPTA